MRTKVLFTVFALFTFTFQFSTAFGQSPEAISYQAVIRDVNNVLVTNQKVGMRISVLQTSVNGTVVYGETHDAKTNANGLVTVEIGNGATSDDFSTIDWSADTYFLKTETDPEGGTNYTITGVSQLLSVPYALYAKTAEFVRNEVDGSITNELQTLSISNDTIYLTNGGFVKVPTSTSAHYEGELYGGGIVFFVDYTGNHGLIASLSDLDGSVGAKWGVYNVYVGNSGSMIDGVSNTKAIIATSPDANTAAMLCSNYKGGGFDDWYLPSLRELSILCSQEYIICSVLDNDSDIKTKGFFREYISPTYGRYWSSTEGLNASIAWTYRFSFNSSTTASKNDTYKVRAIRKF